MRLASLAVVIALAAAGISRGDDAKKKWTEIGVEELAKAIDAGNAHLFDNNPKFVWEKRHIPGAAWLPANQYDAEDLPAEKDAFVVFYCMNEG